MSRDSKLLVLVIVLGIGDIVAHTYETIRLHQLGSHPLLFGGVNPTVIIIVSPILVVLVAIWRIYWNRRSHRVKSETVSSFSYRLGHRMGKKRKQ